MKKYYIGFALLMIATLALYWSVFRCGLSSNAVDWGSFGSYFSGLLLPILTAINILVFAKMTKEISLIDDKRAKSAILSQKEIILMQFRKSEIETFERYIYNAMYPTPTAIRSKAALAMPIGMANLYLKTFLESKLNLFSLSEESETAKSIQKLYERMVFYHEKFIDTKVVDSNDWHGILALHERIIRDLQDITLRTASK